MEKDTTDVIKNTNIEKYVINPKPRPVRPKICCSNGASLKNMIKNICNIGQTKVR